MSYCRSLGRKKEGDVLFNDAFNTFYLRLYSVKYMVKDHSDRERGNLLPPHGLLFPGFYMHHTTDTIHQSWNTGRKDNVLRLYIFSYYQFTG